MNGESMSAALHLSINSVWN